jgi:hypothetical protein
MTANGCETATSVSCQHRLGRRIKISHNTGEFDVTLEGMNMPNRLLGKILCWLGFHDFRIISESFSFGGGGIETVECQRCGLRKTRMA